MISNR